MPNIWWVNQTRCWSCEREAGVVCCAKATREQDETYRARTVSCIRKGDVIVHYISGEGVVALSRAMMDADHRRIDLRKYGVKDPVCDYGKEKGWLVEVQYLDFKQPIPRADIEDALLKLGDQNQVLRSNGWVKLGYLLPFQWRGLEVIRSQTLQPWPGWATAALKAASAKKMQRVKR